MVHTHPQIEVNTSSSQTAPGSSAESIIHQVRRELHERVADPVNAPCRIRHSAYLLSQEGQADRQAVQRGFLEVLQRLEILQRNVNWGERSGRVEAGKPEGGTLRIV